MTTQVKVSAHCSTDKEVKIEVEENGAVETVFIQDGEVWERAVYDSKAITVREIVKPVVQTAP